MIVSHLQKKSIFTLPWKTLSDDVKGEFAFANCNFLSNGFPCALPVSATATFEKVSLAFKTRKTQLVSVLKYGSSYL
jgi:hypothetical protein